MTALPLIAALLLAFTYLADGRVPARAMAATGRTNGGAA